MGQNVTDFGADSHIDRRRALSFKESSPSGYRKRSDAEEYYSEPVGSKRRKNTRSLATLQTAKSPRPGCEERPKRSESNTSIDKPHLLGVIEFLRRENYTLSQNLTASQQRVGELLCRLAENPESAYQTRSAVTTHAATAQPPIDENANRTKNHFSSYSDAQNELLAFKLAIAHERLADLERIAQENASLRKKLKRTERALDTSRNAFEMLRLRARRLINPQVKARSRFALEAHVRAQLVRSSSSICLGELTEAEKTVDEALVLSQTLKDQRLTLVSYYLKGYLLIRNEHYYEALQLLKSIPSGFGSLSERSKDAAELATKKLADLGILFDEVEPLSGSRELSMRDVYSNLDSNIHSDSDISPRTTHPPRHANSENKSELYGFDQHEQGSDLVLSPEHNHSKQPLGRKTRRCEIEGGEPTIQWPGFDFSFHHGQSLSLPYRVATRNAS